MQQFHALGGAILFAAIALGGDIAPPASAAGIVHPSRPDPLLDGTPDGPCAALAEGADYAAGTDVTGHPVVRADVGMGPVAVPDQIVVPLHAGGDGPYAVIDGRRLAPLVNPPGCGNPPPH